MEKTFTYSRAYYRVALSCVIGFACILTGSTVMPLVVVPRLLVAVLFVLPVGAFWAFWLWLSWRYLRAYWTDKISVCDGQVEITRKGASIRVVPEQVQRAQWTFLGGEARLWLDWVDAHVRIDFTNYEQADRRPLIQAFRDAIPHKVQHDWIPDLDSPQQERRFAAEKRAQRVRYVAIVIFLGAAFASPRFFGWPDTFWGYVLMAIAFGAAWIAFDLILSRLTELSR
jgi:hypothetical protein